MEPSLSEVWGVFGRPMLAVLGGDMVCGVGGELYALCRCRVCVIFWKFEVYFSYPHIIIIILESVCRLLWKFMVCFSYAHILELTPFNKECVLLWKFMVCSRIRILSVDSMLCVIIEFAYISPQMWFVGEVYALCIIRFYGNICFVLLKVCIHLAHRCVLQWKHMLCAVLLDQSQTN